jgi:hypothetical protein
MKTPREFSAARRLAIERAAVFLGLTTIVYCGGRRAFGATKLAKSAVQYQNEPNAGKDCDDCIHFVPGATPKSAGSCKIIEGVVSAHGYCVAFTPKRL